MCHSPVEMHCCLDDSRSCLISVIPTRHIRELFPQVSHSFPQLMNLQEAAERTARGSRDQKTIAAMMAVISDLQQRIATLEARGTSPRACPGSNQQNGGVEGSGAKPETEDHLQDLQEQLKETSLASERLIFGSAESPWNQGLNFTDSLSITFKVSERTQIGCLLICHVAFPRQSLASCQAKLITCKFQSSD